MQPARGREFKFAKEWPGNGSEVILSDRLWRGRFAAAISAFAPDVVAVSSRFKATPRAMHLSGLRSAASTLSASDCRLVSGTAESFDLFRQSPVPPCRRAFATLA
jgi:hypothetical protein